MLLRQTRLYEHFSVKELMQRFDSDGDGKLSGEEVEKMNDALLRKRRQVDMQLAAQLSPRTRTKVATIFESHQVIEESTDDDGATQIAGALYTNELRGAIEEMGYVINDEQLERLLAEFDADSSNALDLLEFTALMARMLGYRELPEEQFKLLRKVFHYVDSDSDGNITPSELRAVVERFGLKMVSSQLEAYIAEFDADGDGKINLTEFCNLMSKLHGRLGITTNPAMMAKDLQLTVRKLEQLVSTNSLKTSEALEALVNEARMDAPSFQGETIARTVDPDVSDKGAFNQGVAAAATAAAAAAATAAQRLASQVVVERKGGGPLTSISRLGQVQAAASADVPGGDDAGGGSGLLGGASTRTNSRRDEAAAGERSGGHSSGEESPERRRRKHRDGKHRGGTPSRSRGVGSHAKSKPGRSRKGGSGFDAREAKDDLLTRGVAMSVVDSGKAERPAGLADVSLPSAGNSPSRRGSRSPPSPRSRERIVSELLRERGERHGGGPRGGNGRVRSGATPTRSSPGQGGSPGGNKLIC